MPWALFVFQVTCEQNPIALEQASSIARGINPKVATGLAPALDAKDDVKAQYSFARYAAQNDHYVGLFKTWTKALNFVLGEHWRTKWDGTSMSWMQPGNIPAWRQQPVTNITYAVYRSALAKLTKQRPTLEVVPPSGDPEDQEIAELAEALLTFLWRKLKSPEKIRIFIGWLLVTGTGYLRVSWDPEAGDIQPRTIPVGRPKVSRDTFPQDDAIDAAAAPDAPAGDEADDDEGADSLDELVDVAADDDGNAYRDDAGKIDYARQPDQEALGEITLTPISPFCVRLNPEATSDDDADEMYVATLWPRNKAAEFFGIPEKELQPADESAEQLALYQDMQAATVGSFPRSWQDQTSMWGVDQQAAIGARVLVVEFYAKPCDKYKDGRHWISCGPRKVWPPKDEKEFPNGEAPVPFGFWPPLVTARDTAVPGQPAGIGLITQVVPLNEQLNFLDGKIAEKHSMDAMGGIWIASPEDKGVFKPTSEPGQVQFSNALRRGGQGFAPRQADMKALPEAVYREREVVMAKIQAVSGMSTVDLTSKPEGTPSGRALLVTQETSDAVLVPTLTALEDALEEAGRRQLIIAQQKYVDMRLISIRTQDGQWLYKKFRGADLSDGHDVRVQVGSSFPFSKSAQWDTRLQFLQAVPGLVINAKTGEVDEQKLARLMDPGAPGLAAFETQENPDAIEIRQEHMMFENFDPEDGGVQLPQIGFWQNHAVHLKEHYEFMKRSRARYDGWHPAAQEAFMLHMQLTQMAVDQMAGAALNAVSPMPPAPSEGAPMPTNESDPVSGQPAPQPHGGAPLRIVRPETQSPGPGGARLTRADMRSATQS